MVSDDESAPIGASAAVAAAARRRSLSPPLQRPPLQRQARENAYPAAASLNLARILPGRSGRVAATAASRAEIRNAWAAHQLGGAGFADHRAAPLPSRARDEGTRGRMLGIGDLGAGVARVRLRAESNPRYPAGDPSGDPRVPQQDPTWDEDEEEGDGTSGPMNLQRHSEAGIPVPRANRGFVLADDGGSAQPLNLTDATGWILQVVWVNDDDEPEWHDARVIDVDMEGACARIRVFYPRDTFDEWYDLDEPSIAWRNKRLPGYKVSEVEVERMLRIVSE